MTDDGHGRSTGTVFVRQKTAPMLEPDSKNGKQAGRDFPRRNMLGLSRFAYRSAHSSSPRRHQTQRPAFALAIQEVEIRECPSAGVVDLLGHAHQTFWFGIGQR